MLRLFILFFLLTPALLAAPKRLISLAPSLTSAILELDAAANLIGATDFCTLPSNLDSVQRIGGYQDPNVERIAFLKPDLVLALPEHQKTAQTLEKLGVNCLTLANTNLADIEQTMRTLAAKLEKPDALRDWLAKVAQAKADVSASAKGRRVLLVVSHEARGSAINEVYVAGPSSFLNEILALTGAVNAVSIEHPVYPKLGREALLQVAPDLVINLVPQTACDPSFASKQRQAWLNLPHFAASSSGAITFLCHESVLQAGPRFYEILLAMQRILDGK